jgi:hypothetical protein
LPILAPKNAQFSICINEINFLIIRKKIWKYHKPTAIARFLKREKLASILD